MKKQINAKNSFCLKETQTSSPVKKFISDPKHPLNELIMIKGENITKSSNICKQNCNTVPIKHSSIV